MKTTIVLYPKFQDPIEVTVKYVHKLDNQWVQGYWNIDNNVVVLSYRMYRDFQAIQKQSEKKEFFQNLLRVSTSQLIRSLSALN